MRTPTTPIIRLQARSASAPVLEFLGAPRTGHVVATFARSCYLDLNGRTIALVAPDLHNGPLNLVVEPAPEFDQIAVGTWVSSTAQAVQLAEAFAIILHGAAVWDPVLPRLERTASVRLLDQLQVLQDLVAAEAPAGGLARAGPGQAGGEVTVLEQSAGPALADLAQGLQREDATLVARAVRGLAGLGPGLTPSGDDILVGGLLALAVLPGADAPSMREAMASPARPRTTRISEAYLEAASYGQASEAWHHLIAALLTHDTTRIPDAARAVLAIGETSGSDTLAGFLLAARALLSRAPHVLSPPHSAGA